MSATAFTTLALSAEQLANLAALGYDEMTDIQAAALPAILSGRDLIAQARTGSGKTATFGLGIMHTLDPQRLELQALVLCPTRELADQVAVELRRLARAAGNVKILTLVGGAPMRLQAESLAHGVHIAVATPGRLLDLLARGSVSVDRVGMLVLDEADRMVDMGFFEDVLRIAAVCPVQRQTLLFSATYPDTIRKDAARLLRQPVEIKVASRVSPKQIEQYFFEIEPDGREAAVLQLLNHFRPASALAFCNTKVQVRQLTQTLQGHGLSALALHGDLEQRERDEVLIQFANQSCAVLVATDVAARGLDIPSLPAVINVEVTRDPEVHIHRIGRTGRGDEKGLALNVCAPEEMMAANAIEIEQGQPLQWRSLQSCQPTRTDPLRAPMVTLLVLGGKKDKLRAGDILGALGNEAGLSREQVGKITVTDSVTYVALARDVAKATLQRLAQGKIKGKRFRVKFIGG